VCLAEGDGRRLSVSCWRSARVVVRGQGRAARLCGSCGSLLSLNRILLFVSFQNSSAPLAEDIDPEVRIQALLGHGTGSLPAGLRCSSSFSPWQLARYLNRNYWEKKQEEVRKSPTPSAPLSLTEPAAQPGEAHAAPLGVVEVRGGLNLCLAACGEERPAPSFSPATQLCGLAAGSRHWGVEAARLPCPSSSSTRTASLRRTTSSS